MKIHPLTRELSVSPQIVRADLAELQARGFRSIVCHRPDGEGPDQPGWREIADEAGRLGMTMQYQPVESGKVVDADAEIFSGLMQSLPKPVLAYCRTGTRSATLWALSQATTRPMAEILETAKAGGYDLKGVVRRIANGGKTPPDAPEHVHEVVIIGGGAAGIAVASSLLARAPGLDIALIDPADVHYYQPGWTLVGAGIFTAAQTARTMSSIIPRGVQWHKAGVVAFEPERNAVILEGCRVVRYQHLVVCPGLKLDWNGIEGLSETLGQNGVTSNYRFDLAPYTWNLVQKLKGGKALFTQPPMPIKCAGAPQKAMYLSSDHWQRNGVLKDIDVQFCNAGGVLFGVPDYVPALMEYIRRYDITLNFGHTLTAIDGPARKATFSRTLPDGGKETVVSDFDMIHVVPPQKAPDFIRVSPLADATGWIDLDPGTLRHKTLPNVYGLGDAGNTSNAKTAAAARKQAPVVANNLLVDMGRGGQEWKYDGYGSCPLTVERGKIVLAEFLYGGKVAPSFPKWLIDGTRPSRAAWLLKERVLPPLYWDGMLKGREWMARPEEVR
ncbi:MAG: TIGR01244 family phosphatase [Gammaproteobacteria bacterium]|nr:TIGR01244 family phosphatase [Gammaproteobacteria bacterium]MBU1440795.1 TIGR01244 family phosphatase [Gammaproteobacteria bacterium]MBU2287782.1 TIGR01244 family phosphatase [Gammaproteobacteria bacterium]